MRYKAIKEAIAHELREALRADCGAWPIEWRTWHHVCFEETHCLMLQCPPSPQKALALEKAVDAVLEGHGMGPDSHRPSGAHIDSLPWPGQPAFEGHLSTAVMEWAFYDRHFENAKQAKEEQ